MKQEKKVIPIDKILHEELKNFCKSNGYVIKSFVEKLIKQELEKNGNSLHPQEEKR